MKDKSASVLKKQKLVFVSIGLVTVGVLAFFIVGGNEISNSRTAPVSRKIDLPIDAVDAQNLWLNRIESGNKILEDKVKVLEELVVAQKREEGAKLKETESLRKEIYRLQQAKEEKKNNESSVSKQKMTPSPFGSPISQGTTVEENIPQVKHSGNLTQVSMGGNKKKKVKHIDEVIPSGSSVRAVLVSSVDAPCGVYSSSDPYPVKLRILDDAKLPGGVKVKLKGGIIIASAYGNISSERVYVRLDRITQTKPSGEFIETEVTGFVSGEDGKYGVRGIVADKSQKLIESAAFSGFFQGLSSFFQSTVAADSLSNSTNNLPNIGSADLLKSSGLRGVGNAMEKVSDYYIKRAEQLQPVIQIEAGRVVDITFTFGTEVGDIHTKEKVKKIRDSSREGGSK
jgi:conjugal transfer pilus assembly protein TraB